MTPIKAYFYDIESLDNVFTLCNFRPGDENCCDVFYLCDDPALTADPDLYANMLAAVHEANKNFDGKLNLYDLHAMESVRYLTVLFGMSDADMVNNPFFESSYPDEFRPVCDTDKNYDPDVHPYFMGYNSANYDTTMLAAYFNESWEVQKQFDPASGQWTKQLFFRPVTASYLRMLNNELFSERFKSSMPTFLACAPKFGANGRIEGYGQASFKDVRWRIRKNMLMSGRQIDVARLNEKAQKVGLKRLIGMLGGQILESEKLRPGVDHIDTPQEFYDLVAYNVSDCVNLKLKVFDHSVYQGQFSLKKKLLEDYPELIYERDMTQKKHVPDVRPDKVRKDRLFIDSSSAQLATKALCPYGHLTDIPAVSFMYPHRSKAEELGIPQVNVLEETRRFFYSKFPQPELRAQFDKIYNYYKSIEGRNFNESRNYSDDYGMDFETGNGLPAESTKSLPATDTCLFYYNQDGTPSSGFVTFSIGGIHGAEYNKQLFEHDLANWKAEYDLLRQVQAMYPDPCELKKAKKVQLEIDGETREFTAGTFLKSGSTAKKAFYKDLEAKKPRVFRTKKDSEGTELNKNYTFTSADPTNHEDFKSYYPNLLRMMAAFYNAGLGYDRYAEIFYQKEDLGVLMKDKNADYAKLRAKTDPNVLVRYDKLRASSGLTIDPDVISDEERAVYAVQREGTKLILNSASGAADATFESNIRMNNQIISMRIIGQLFSYRIGQAQTYAGAKVTSTNTDGLFTVMEAEENNRLLEQESHDIGVEIEPEPTYLISKDTNNRIEMDIKTGDVQAASGGTLSCRSWAGKKGPSPTKSLAHPAIIDWALCEYLVFAATDRSGRTGLDLPFNPEVGMNILKSAAGKMTKVRLLNMYQNVIASSPSSVSYIFNTEPGRPDVPHNMQHYNRVFIMKDRTPDTVHLHMAVSRKLTPVQISKRMANNERPQQNDEIAIDILERNGVRATDIPHGYEASIKKVTNIEDTWFMLIENHDLEYLTDERVDFIIDNMDYGKYLYLLGDCFESNWRNKLPGGKPPTHLIPFTKDLDQAMADFKAGVLSAPSKSKKKAPAKPDAQDGQDAKKGALLSDPDALPEDSQAGVAAEKPTASDNAGSGDDIPPWEFENPEPPKELPKDPDENEDDGSEGDGSGQDLEATLEDVFPGQVPDWSAQDDAGPLTPEQIRAAHEKYLRENLNTNPYGTSDEPMPEGQVPDLSEINLPDAQKAVGLAMASKPTSGSEGIPETDVPGQLALPGFDGAGLITVMAHGRNAVRASVTSAVETLKSMRASCPDGATEIADIEAIMEKLESVLREI